MSRSSRMKKWLSGSLLGLVLLALLLLHAAPGIGLAFARHWYAGQGDGYDLKASSWDFSPFSMDLRLNGLTLTHPGSGNGETRIGTFELRLNPYAALNHHLDISRMTVSGIGLKPGVVEADGAQTLTLAGLTIPLGGDASPVASTESALDSVDDEASQPWTFSVGRIEFDHHDLGWQVSLPGMNSDGQLRIQSLILTDINSDNRPVQVDVTLMLPELNLTTAAADGLPQTLALATGDDKQPLRLKVEGQLLQPLTAPQWQGDVTLDNLMLSSNQNGGVLVSLSELSLRGIDADASQQKFAHLRLAALSVQQQGQPLFALAQYQLTDFSYREDDVSVGDQSYQGLVVTVPDLQSESPAEVAERPEAANNNDSSMQASGAEEQASGSITKALVFVIAGLHQAQEQPGQIIVRDSSVEPVMTSTLTLKELNIGEADGQVKGQSVNLNKPVSIHLLAGFDDYNRIAVDGALSMFERDGAVFPQGQIKANIEQLDLVPFNGYLGRAMGYHVERGMLNLDADIRFDQAQLGGELKILLRNARFVPADDAAIERLSKQISMPVDTALDLLRDDNGNVRLTIPLSGDLSDPDVGLNDLTRQLSRLALRQGAMYYLRQSLQPYTTMLTVASYAGDYLFAVRLDDLTFSEQSSELSEEHTAHLQKVADIMQSKTRLELQVCPFVSKEESVQLGDSWPQLAKARGAAVKAWLAGFNDQNGSSLAQRVSLCKPQQGQSATVVLGVE